MKYVMVLTDKGQRLPVLFPDSLNHDLVAGFIVYAIQAQLKCNAHPISAGFVSLGEDVTVHGRSESLKLEPMPHDAARIMVGDSIAFMSDAQLAPLLDKLKEVSKDDTLEYLLNCVEQHAQKFPVPEHMLSAVKLLREAHGLTAPTATPTHGDSGPIPGVDFGDEHSQAPTPRICDCERGHNGLGISGRECDCQDDATGGDST